LQVVEQKNWIEGIVELLDPKSGEVLDTRTMVENDKQLDLKVA